MLEMNFRWARPSYGIRLEGKSGAYRLAPRKPPQDIGGAFDMHSDLKDISNFPTLFLEFSSLKRTAKAVEGFADDLGTIGRASQFSFALSSPVQRYPTIPISWKTDEFSNVSRWFPEIRKMNKQVTAWLGGTFPQTSESTRSGLLGRGTVCNFPDRDAAVKLAFVPDQLLDALWIQFALAVERKAQFRCCEFEVCGQWFEVGAGSGKRSHARFCREKCRNDFNNNRKK